MWYCNIIQNITAKDEQCLRIHTDDIPSSEKMYTSVTLGSTLMMKQWELKIYAIVFGQLIPKHMLCIELCAGQEVALILNLDPLAH